MMVGLVIVKEIGNYMCEKCEKLIIEDLKMIRRELKRKEGKREH